MNIYVSEKNVSMKHFLYKNEKQITKRHITRPIKFEIWYYNMEERWQIKIKDTILLKFLK